MTTETDGTTEMGATAATDWTKQPGARVVSFVQQALQTGDLKLARFSPYYSTRYVNESVEVEINSGLTLKLEVTRTGDLADQHIADIDWN